MFSSSSHSSNMSCSFKLFISRVQKKMCLRRKKQAKPRLVISAPFNFKKEDTMGFLPGISSEELCVLREKAVASIVGSATTSLYPDPPLRLALSPLASDPGHCLVRSGTNTSATTATTTCTSALLHASLPSSRTFGQSPFGRSPFGRSPFRYHRDVYAVGSLAFHPIVLASTEPFLPAGLTSPPSSSASSVHSFRRDRD